MAKMYYAQDCDLNRLNGKTVAIMGYGYGIFAYRIPLYIGISAVEIYVIYILLKNKTLAREIERIKH